MADRRRPVLCTLTALACVAVLAQHPSARQNRIAHMYVSVTDKAGRSIAGLTAADFTVTEDDAPREIVRVGPATEPLSVALLIDRFGYGSGAPTGSLPFGVLDVRRTVLTILRTLRQAGPDTRVGLWTFDGASIERFKLTADTRDMEAFIAKMSPISSQPVLLDALEDASKALVQEPSRRRVIFALMAGYKFDESSPLLLTQALFDRADASLWVLAGRASFPVPELGNSNHSNAEPWIDIGIKYSGGHFDAVSVGTALESQAKRMAELVVSQYLIDFVEPSPSAHPVTIHVKPPGAKVLAPALPHWISR